MASKPKLVKASQQGLCSHHHQPAKFSYIMDSQQVCAAMVSQSDPAIFRYGLPLTARQVWLTMTITPDLVSHGQPRTASKFQPVLDSKDQQCVCGQYLSVQPGLDYV